MIKYYKPWSVRWIIQRFIIVIKQGSLSRVSFKTLINDYRSTRKVNKSLKRRSLTYPHVHDPVNDKSFPSGLPSNQLSDRVTTCANLAPDQLSSLNKFFDHIYIVNLVRRVDRRQIMEQKLTKLNIKAEFFPAEDGTSDYNLREFLDYSNAPVDQNNAHEIEIKLKRKAIFSPGEWGTLKTYKNILKEAGERGFEKILCLEDDTIFAKDFEELFKQAGKIIPDNWKILYLGASQHTWEENTDLIIPDNLFDDITRVKYYLPLNTDGAFAIGLKKQVFSTIISEISKMNCAFDSGALRNATKVFKGDCFVLSPNLIIADVRESDIRIGRKQNSFAEIVRWNLNFYDLSGF
jgi:GR25 family glycosyltransferase involved in LPS biosynthesis